MKLSVTLEQEISNQLLSLKNRSSQIGLFYTEKIIQKISFVNNNLIFTFTPSKKTGPSVETERPFTIA